MAIFSAMDKWLSRASSAYSFWPLVPAGVVGVITGWLASGASVISQYGAFGWWSASILAFMLTSFGLAGAGYAWEKFAYARAVRKWSSDVDNLDPMAKNISNKQIKVIEIAHPVHNKIKNKNFDGCEFIGPANVIFWGQSIVTGISFGDCDIVILRDQVYVHNAIAFLDCTITNSEFFRCTVYVTQDMHDLMKQSLPQLEAITHGAP